MSDLRAMQALAKRHNGRKSDTLKRSSPESWFSLSPLTADEAIIWGPCTRAQAAEFQGTISASLSPPCQKIDVSFSFQMARCQGITVTVIHHHFRRKLAFHFPVMRAAEIVERIWTAITTAMTTPNVDPVSLARESLSHGPQARQGKI